MLRQYVILIIGLWFTDKVKSDTTQSPKTNTDVNQTGSFIQFFEKVNNRSIRIEGRDFLLDNETFHILSGSVHYFRIPADYWRDRLRKLKAAGFNSVSTYVEWSYHEPEERQYQFKADHDVEQFIRVAAEENLYVLLRVGPYICAERDLGGLPYWLLSKYPQIKLRTSDPHFMNETRIWLKKLFKHLTPLLYKNGGPIILVQVENEYGYYTEIPDDVYKEELRTIISQHVQNKALLYTTDPPELVKHGEISGALSTIDFGVGHKVLDMFEMVFGFNPVFPLMNSEFYVGWMTHWGKKFKEVSADAVVTSLRDMLVHSINLNMYMFSGGTNFEFGSGANFIDEYTPQITSYDYNAPLNEAGDPTKKYYAIRSLLLKYKPELKNTTAPVPSPKGDYGRVKVAPQINLMSSEGRAMLGKHHKRVTGTKLPTFEKLRQRAGLVLYETNLTEPTWTGDVLRISKPRDRIYVYIDYNFVGCIDRSTSKTKLIFGTQSGTILSLLVENMGRINFGPYLHDFKGILSEVKFNNVALEGPWMVTGYPFAKVNKRIQDLDHISIKNGPVLYQGRFHVTTGIKPLDSFLDTTGWGKGYVWVNGHNLGRYWPRIGPQVTLYVPGVWLHKAPTPNILQILELEKAPGFSSMNFIANPILGCNTCKNK